jgi:hypothetical protein
VGSFEAEMMPEIFASVTAAAASRPATSRMAR